MNDPSSSSTAWPAARPTGISPLQHPAWEEARNAILDLAAEGPVTAVIVGAPGTGKTWLLRELASALGDHGFPTMMLMRGNLPMTLSSGAALLVDDASLMDPATRAQMSAQQHGVVVLAAEDWFDDDHDSVLIPLRPLRPAELADFAAEWFRRAGSPLTLDHATLSRLVTGSRGCVGMLIPLLRATAATWQQAAEAPPPPPPPPRVEPAPPQPARRRRLHRPLLAGSAIAAIAAMIALGWALMPAPPPAKIAQAPTPSPVTAAAAPAPLPPLQPADTSHPAQPSLADAAPAAPALPPLRHADIPDAALVTAAIPAQPRMAIPPLAGLPTPRLDAATLPVQLPSPAPAIAAASPPPVLPLADPVLVATLEDPDAAPVPRNRAGSPGLILVAQRGDTLESLYGSVYRDRSAPPFANVVAANPGPFKPGAIVVFPEPPGGWQRAQR